MSSFCTAKATHIFFSKKFHHICVYISLNVNFNESLTNDIVSFEQLGPVVSTHSTEYPQHVFMETYETIILILLIIGAMSPMYKVNNIAQKKLIILHRKHINMVSKLLFK